MKKDPASPNWAFLSKFEVWHDGQLYLRRWRIFECPWFGIYIHNIKRPDRDRDLHDHPWPFISFVLKGAYVEEVPCKKHNQKIYSCPTEINFVEWCNLKRATDSHRIKSTFDEGVWTLVLRGRRQRVWGFHTKDGWKPWHEYLDENQDPLTKDLKSLKHKEADVVVHIPNWLETKIKVGVIGVLVQGQCTIA